MVKKIKSSTCSTSWCTNHLFQLNPLAPGRHFKKPTKIRLCPIHNKATNGFDDALPMLNCDNKYYTPLFILQEQKKYYDDHDQRARASHQKLEERELEDQSYFTIYEPKHARDSPYCSVCQKSYGDYLQHIQSHDHKKNLDSTIFTRYIMQIQQQFKKEFKEIPKCNQNILKTSKTTQEVNSKPQNYQDQIDMNESKGDLPQLKRGFSYKDSFIGESKPYSNIIQNLFPDTTTIKEMELNF